MKKFWIAIVLFFTGFLLFSETYTATYTVCETVTDTVTVVVGEDCSYVGGGGALICTDITEEREITVEVCNAETVTFSVDGVDLDDILNEIQDLTGDPDATITTATITDIQIAIANGESIENFENLNDFREELNDQVEETREELKEKAREEMCSITGDPVRTALGSFVSSGTDLSYSSHNLGLEFTRFYDSNNNSTHSFGTGWSFNYDLRIIRGTFPNITELVNAAEETYLANSRNYEESKAQYDEAFGKIDAYYSSLTSALANINTAIDKLENAYSHAPSEVKSGIQSDINTVSSKRALILDDLAEVEPARQNLSDNYSNIESMAILQQESLESLNYYTNVKRASEANLALNKYTYNATDSENLLYSGIDTINFVNEAGSPTTYILDAEPDYTSGEQYLDGTMNFWPGGSTTTAISPTANTLQLLADGGIVVTEEDGTEYLFNIFGQIVRITQRNGNDAKFLYSDGRLISLSDSFGRETSISWLGDKISAITLPDNSSVSYQYTGDKLVGVSDPEGALVRFEYEGNLLTRIIKPDASFRTYNYEMIAGKHRVTRTEDEEGRKEFFAYDFTPGNHSCTYINIEGVKEKQYFDEELNTIRKEIFNGEFTENIKEYAYDERGNATRYILKDNLGKVLYSEDKTYDLSSRITSRKRNGIPVEALTYTVDGELNSYSYQTPGGWETISYYYDAMGNLTRIFYPDGTTEEFKYNSRWLVKEYKDRTGHCTYMTYDKYGSLETQREELLMYGPNSGSRTSEIQTRWVNDTLGRPLEQMIFQDEEIQYYFSYEYTQEGRMVAYKALAGEDEFLLTGKNYSERKDLFAESNWFGGKTLLEYDQTHKLEMVTNELGEVIDYVYDDQGRMIGRVILDSYGLAVENWTYQYDGLSRVKKEEELLSGYVREHSYYTNGKIKEQLSYLSSLPEDNEVIQYSYDPYLNPDIIIRNGLEVTDYDIDPASGMLLSLETPGGRSVSYQYDEQNRVIRQEGSGGITSYKYDPYGRITSIEAKGIVQNYQYNGRGELVRDWVGNRDYESRYFGYDGAGKLLASSDRLDNWEEFRYDGLGRLVRQIHADGTEVLQNWEALEGGGFRSILTDEEGYVWIKEFDTLARITSQLDPEGKRTALEYDPLGRRITFTDQLDNRWTYGYSLLGLTRETDPEEKSTLYAYRVTGELLRITDPAGKIKGYSYGYKETSAGGFYRLDLMNNGELEHSYLYDLDQNLSQDISPSGVTHQYLYNTSGQLSGEINSRGYIQSYGYEQDRLVRKTDFNQDQYEYNYDTYGNITSIIVNGTNHIGKTHDPNGRLLKAESLASGVSNSFAYNSRGLLEYSSSSMGDTIEYGYTSRGNLEKETRFLTDETITYSYNALGLPEEIQAPDVTAQFEYDARGMLTLKKLGNGMSNRRSYNSLGQMTQASLFRDNQVFASTSYLYNNNNQISYIINEKGELTAYQYDQFDRISDVYYPLNGRPVSVALDEKKEAGLGNPNNNGANGIRQPARLNLSFPEREMIQDAWNTQDKQQSNHFNFNQNYWYERYRYDIDGNRIEKSDARGTIIFGYAQGVMRTRGNNSLSYDNNGNLLRETGPDYFMEYQYNKQNRMLRAMTREHNKDLEVLYAYDGLGRRTSRAENTFQHNGKLQSSNIENYYYRGMGFTYAAREYNPGNNRTELQSFYQSAGGLLAFTGKRDTHYAYTDYQGTLLGYTTHNNLQERYLYDVFGTPVMGKFNGVNVLGYNGKVYDEATGLHNYGYRDYQSAYGRFSTVDPVRDSLNWYAYCGNNPINYIDPTGLEIEAVFHVTSIEDNQKGGFTARGYLEITNIDTGETFTVEDIYSGGYGTDRKPETWASNPAPFGTYDILENTGTTNLPLYNRLEAQDGNYGDDTVNFEGQPEHAELRIHSAGGGNTWGCVSVPNDDALKIVKEINNTNTTTVEVESKARNPFTRGFWTGKEEQTKFGELTIIDETCGD